MEQYFSKSAAETMELGYQLGQRLSPGTVVCLFGDLAAGKTTFIKGLVVGAAQLDPSIVQSPTFAYLNIYEGNQKIYHFDLYRLKDVDEFFGMGFEEFFDQEGICCIEWSERIGPCLPSEAIYVTLCHEEENTRTITITSS